MPEETKIVEDAIDEKLNEWERDLEPVMRHHHSEHVEAFSLSKSRVSGEYQLAFAFFFGGSANISIDYTGNDLVKATEAILKRWV